MHRSPWLLLLLLTTLLANGASAREFSLGVLGGPAMPVGPIADIVDRGYQVQASLGMGSTAALTAGLIEAGGDAAQEEQLRSASGGDFDQLRIRIWSLMFESRYPLFRGGPVIPFLRIGSGLTRFVASATGPGGERTRSEMGFGAGIGLGLFTRLNGRMALQVTGSYELSHMPDQIITVGSFDLKSRAMVQFVPVQVGLQYRLGG